MRRAIGVALAALAAGCAGAGAGRVEPRLVGRYVRFGIDAGELIELRADGTYEIGSVGMCPLPLRITGRWRADGGRVLLQPLAWGVFGEMGPIPANVERDCEHRFVVEGTGEDLALMDDSEEEDLRWRRGMRWGSTDSWRLP